MAEMNMSEQDELKSRYEAAKRRLLLFDYDGTLVPIAERPEDSVPSDALLGVMKKLSDDPYNTVVVISGRPHEVLDEWLGHLPIEFVAEHSVMRRSKEGAWAMTVTPNEGQIAAATTLLSELSACHPGTMIEKKRVGVTLHYRHAPSLDDAAITQWIVEHGPELSRHGIDEIHGKKILELVPRGVDKGSAARHWLDRDEWDFVLAAGDDTTDEAMFRALKPGEIGLHVGTNPATVATYSVAEQLGFMRLLEQLAD